MIESKVGRRLTGCTLHADKVSFSRTAKFPSIREAEKSSLFNRSSLSTSESRITRFCLSQCASRERKCQRDDKGSGPFSLHICVAIRRLSLNYGGKR